MSFVRRCWFATSPAIASTREALVRLLTQELMKASSVAESRALVARHGATTASSIWSRVFANVCDRGHTHVARDALRELRAHRAPTDAACYNPVIAALARQGYDAEVERLVAEMEQHGVRKDVVTYNSMCVDRDDRSRSSVAVVCRCLVVTLRNTALRRSSSAATLTARSRSTSACGATPCSRAPSRSTF